MPRIQAAEREFRRRFWWAISVPLILMAILAGLFAIETDRLNSSLQAMSRSNDILIHTARLRRDAIDAQTDALQFLIVRDPNLLRSYEIHQNRLPEIVNDLEKARGNAGQSSDPVARAYQNWRTQLDQTVHSSPQDSVRRASADRSSWNALLGSIDDLLQTQIAERAQNAAAAQGFVHRGASFGIGIALILGILLSLFTRRQLKEIAFRYRKAVEDAVEKAQTAEQALLSRDDFFSIASHELKTPVTTMELRAHTLQTALDRAALPPTSRSSINSSMRSMRRQIQRLSELIENILDVSQINRGQIPLTRSHNPVSVDSLIHKSIASAKDILDQFNCRVELHSQPATARDWDTDRITQAMKALISNSAKYAPNSTIEINSSVVRDNQIRIEITDHGLGIAPKDHPRIFRLFERGVSSHHYGGLGTGLYITREIIERHGGTIRVLSHEGLGATVIIDLPLSATQKHAAA